MCLEPIIADCFTHFFCVLDVGTADNAVRALDLYNALSEEAASEEPPSDGFLLSIQPEHGGMTLWMHDDGTGDPERLIAFVKRCAAAFGLTAGGAFNMPRPARARASTGLAAGRTSSISPPARRSPGLIPAVGSPPCWAEATPMPEVIETLVYRTGERDEVVRGIGRT